MYNRSRCRFRAVGSGRFPPLPVSATPLRGSRPCRLAIEPRHRRLQEGDRLSVCGAQESSDGPVPTGRGTCWPTPWNSSVLLPSSSESIRPFVDIQGRSRGRGCGCHFAPAMLSWGCFSSPQRARDHLGQSGDLYQLINRLDGAKQLRVGRLRCDVRRSSSNNVQLPALAREDNGHPWHRSRTVWTGLSPALECARRHHICFTSSPHFLGCGNWHLVGRSESKGLGADHSRGSPRTPIPGTVNEVIQIGSAALCVNGLFRDGYSPGCEGRVGLPRK